MYHDQGLPVLKYASFGRGVNVTPRLPFVTHLGRSRTALDIARQRPMADPAVSSEAFKLAIELASAS